MKKTIETSDADLLLLLGHCRSGFASVTPLLQRCERTRLYRRVNHALSNGLLIKGPAGEYRATERGISLLSPAAASLLAADDPLIKAVPHLGIIGDVSPFHQAAAELVLAAAIARTNGLRDSHHPSFVFVGERLRFKTWLGRACCAMLGADDRLCILHSLAETKGSMFKRRDQKGKMTSERKILTTSPICVVDEYQRAPQAVRGIMALVMDGRLSVPFENETATIRAVPTLVMNPLKALGSLSERTGLDAALLRRSVVLDLSAATIPRALLPRGDAMCDDLRRLPVANLSAPSDLSEPPMTKLQAVIERSLKSADFMADIDLSLVGLLAVAMRAFLPPCEALRRVLFDFLLVLSTTGRTRDGWQENLTVLDGETKAEPTPEPVRPPNPLSWTGNLTLLAEVLDAVGVSLPDVQKVLRSVRTVEELDARLVGKKRELAVAIDAESQSRSRHVALKAAIADAQQELADVQYLAELLDWQGQLEALGFTRAVIAEIAKWGMAFGHSRGVARADTGVQVLQVLNYAASKLSTPQVRRFR